MGERIYNLRNLIILAAILALGFLLRAYNLNFPSLGYHDMKENEYLSMAQEMQRTGDYTTRRVYFYSAFEDEPSMQMYPQPPLISYQVLLSWRLLGENLWQARLFNVLFGVASILAIYFICLVLFHNVILSLFCSFLLAIMPLAVFFSRNIQPESPAFFFMLLGNLFYLKYASSLKKRNLLIGGVCFSVSWLYKFSFLIGLFPFIFCLPFRALFKKKSESLKFLLALLCPYLIILITILSLKHIGQWGWEPHVLRRISIWEVFTPAYWAKYGRTVWWYAKGENFTYVYIVLSLLGILVALFRRRGLLNRYILGWVITIIPYCMIFSDFINQHNYYQMPFLVLVCVASVYSLSFIPQIVTIKNIPEKILLISLMAVTAGVSAPFVYNSILRMHGTVFLGLDVAGESLKEFTKDDERVFLLAHAQGRGVARYARRYAGWTDDPDDFKAKEKKFGIRYICFYPAEQALALKANNPPLFEYVQANYHVKEVGLTEEPSNLYYIILEKGAGSDPNTFLQSFEGARQLRTIYKVIGRHVFFYALRPQAKEAREEPPDGSKAKEAKPAKKNKYKK